MILLPCIDTNYYLLKGKTMLKALFAVTVFTTFIVFMMYVAESSGL